MRSFFSNLTYVAILVSNLSTKSNSFAPSKVSNLSLKQTINRRNQIFIANGSTGSLLVDPSSMITPEGFGFSSPIERVLREAKRGDGYYKVKSSDTVTDVIDAITNSDKRYDVALVFDEENDNKLLGLFTEIDYIRFSKNRSQKTSSVEESALFLMASVLDYMTPVDKLICLKESDTANVAIALMSETNVRHIVVADKVSPGYKLEANTGNDNDSKVIGVISMQDVMSLIQKDERLSLNTLKNKYPSIKSPVERLNRQLISDANKLADNPTTAKEDIIRYGSTILFGVTIAAFFSQNAWLHAHADWAMIAIFVVGYLGIIFEEVLEFNKAGVALLMSTALWITYADYFGDSTGVASGTVLEQLSEQLAEVSDICFFLLAASTIVEVVDSHQGFKVVTNKITTTSKRELFWTIGFLTFILSAILNNLTVTIVMVSLLRKLVPKFEDRRLFGAMVVVAANAGGVWTPIGDVTTTMLWINNQLSTIPTIVDLFLPSVACLVCSLAYLVRQVDDSEPLVASEGQDSSPLSTRGQLIFWGGIACLLAVPVFNEFTGLPPYLAMLTGLGVMWTLTDVIHMGEESEEGLKVPAALARLDTSGILFFLGILMSIGVLDKSGLLKQLAVYLSDTLPSLDIIATAIGIFSALIDNVPLVAATMGMYDLTEFGTDDKLWQLIALCAGTGGSILVIGSASGVALMGLEKIDFVWYAKNVSIGATIGYFAGIATYLLQYSIVRGGLLGEILPQAAVAAEMIQQNLPQFM